jgi:hypothetical protein
MIEVTGTTAPNGEVTVSGGECVNQDNEGPIGGGTASVILYRRLTETTQQFVMGSGSIVANPDGTWEWTLTIPADAVTGDTYRFDASCQRFISGDPVSLTYEEVDFVMGEAVETTTTTTAADTTTTASSTDTTAAPAVTAASTGATTSPRYTG